MNFGNIVGGSKYKLLVWLGISNIENFKTWKNVDGKSIPTYLIPSLDLKSLPLPKYTGIYLFFNVTHVVIMKAM